MFTTIVPGRLAGLIVDDLSVERLSIHALDRDGRQRIAVVLDRAITRR